MKATILLLAFTLILSACATRKSAPDISCKWTGRNTLVIVIDSTGNDTYKPVYIKLILKKEKNKKDKVSHKKSL